MTKIISNQALIFPTFRILSLISNRHSLDTNDFSCFVNLQESCLLHMQQSHGLLMSIWDKTKPVKKISQKHRRLSFNQMAPKSDCSVVQETQLCHCQMEMPLGVCSPPLPFSRCSAPQLELCRAGSAHTSLTTGVMAKMDSEPCGSITCWHAGHQNLKLLSGLIQIRCQ